MPVEVQRAVRERDRDQRAFVDAEGRRCSEKRFLTIEHVEPFALDEAACAAGIVTCSDARG